MSRRYLAWNSFPFAFLLVCSLVEQAMALRASPRTLTYPVTAPTRWQFICGIGIPFEDLVYESVTSGYVLKAEYFLPERADEFTRIYLKPQTIDRRSIAVNVTTSGRAAAATATTLMYRHHGTQQQRQQQSANSSSNYQGANIKSHYKNASFYRWLLYRSIELILNRGGLAGRTCVLRSICEHAAVPLNYESGLAGELLHIILTPSTSFDKLAHHSDKDYLAAEILGRSDGDCERRYSECPHSPLDQISALFHLPDETQS